VHEILRNSVVVKKQQNFKRVVHCHILYTTK